MSKPYTNCSFKQARLVDPNRRVQVYKNLHKNVYSVKQDRVVFHCNIITLSDARFNVSPAGREKVRREKKKNVHATVSGYITDIDVMEYQRVTYNPYENETFIFAENKLPIHFSDYCTLNKNGVWV